jgi:hypothetical protein
MPSFPVAALDFSVVRHVAAIGAGGGGGNYSPDPSLCSLQSAAVISVIGAQFHCQA